MMATGLPWGLRLRRAATIALLIGIWAPFKIAWEQQIAHEQDFLRYRGVTVTRQLRDQLGQGLTIGVLSGMRSVVADMVWLQTTVAWEYQEWFKMESLINLCTALQPRALTFWDVGGWQLAWNASVAATEDIRQPNQLRRLKASHFWIEKGLAIYLRGIENNPEQYKLWADTGLLYQQRLLDNRTAAYYYAQATLRPDCPVFYERFPAIMYGNAGDDASAYAEWQKLWAKLTPKQRTETQHLPTPSTLVKIRAIEKRLSIPPEKRVFPN